MREHPEWPRDKPTWRCSCGFHKCSCRAEFEPRGCLEWPQDRKPCWILYLSKKNKKQMLDFYGDDDE